MALECPQCGRIDNVAKVSGIAAAGTSTATQTALAGRLSPPAEPTFRLGGLIIVGLVMGISTLLLDLDPALILGAAVIIGIGVLGYFDTNKKRRKWKEEMDRWRKLYYCSRCDLVFEP